MKRVAVISLAIVALAGCELLNILDPLVGHWKMELVGTVTTYAFDPDRTTCLMTFESSIASGASKGTFTESNGILTITWQDGTVYSELYKTKGDTMTWTPTAGWPAITLVRSDIPWQN